MPFRAVAAAFALFVSAGVFGQPPSPTALAQLPNGTISGETYSNDALGVIFHLPSSWTASLDAGRLVFFGRKPDGPANKCTRVLLRYEAPRKVKG
jgi:hypothetical protein